MRTIIFGTLLLCGCATSTEGIQGEAVNETYTSAKAPLVIARCLQEEMRDLDLELGDGFVSVSRRNQFDSILLNWMIRETPTGSTIELRKTNSIAGGEHRATHCF